MVLKKQEKHLSFQRDNIYKVKIPQTLVFVGFLFLRADIVS